MAICSLPELTIADRSCNPKKLKITCDIITNTQLAVQNETLDYVW